ncbi:Coiled-coil domain-containing protein 22 [Lamellibrachia satsuma]|nr:Coiled-coil domain-containing protein 22 [Lamellibrachia satsuma]
MEEVDGIVIHTLRSIGCDIDDEVRSLQQFTTAMFVDATAQCLKMIKPGVDVPHKLPPSMSACFRVGSRLAAVIKDVGFHGDAGYQTFLYSSETDMRRVFMFLIEKLPKHSTGVADEPLGSMALLRRRIAADVARRLRAPWTPHYCKVKDICWRGQPPQWQREGCSARHQFHAVTVSAPEGLADLQRKVPKELRRYYATDLTYVSHQPAHHCDIVTSLLESNAVRHSAEAEWEAEWGHTGLASRLTPQEYKAQKRKTRDEKIGSYIEKNMKQVETSSGEIQHLQQLVDGSGVQGSGNSRMKGSRFTHTEKLQFAQDVDVAVAQMKGGGAKVATEEERESRQQGELQSLQSELATLSSRLDSVQLQLRALTGKQQQMEETLPAAEEGNREREEAYMVKKRTIDLLPEADNNIAKLQEVVDASHQRLTTLNDQWERIRGPLEEEYRSLQMLGETQMSETDKKLEEMKEMRMKMKQLASESRSKGELCKQLVSEYEQMTKDVNRSTYTRRILEIVSNIKKQKKEIDKVLRDTRMVQKEINQLSGKLDRTFTVTDELIFRDAKKDEATRKAYKYLAALHENCSVLAKTVEDTGVIMREIRELEDQIEQESSKKTLSNFERITADYREMKKENAALIAKLKKLEAL